MCLAVRIKCDGTQLMLSQHECSPEDADLNVFQPLIVDTYLFVYVFALKWLKGLFFVFLSEE